VKNLSFLILFCLLGIFASNAQFYGLDSTFATNGIYARDTGGYTKIALQQDRKILVTGMITESQEFRNVVQRFNEDGTIDKSFANNGYFRPEVLGFNYIFIENILIQPDGKILLGGGANHDFVLIRLNPLDGSLDTNFGNNGVTRGVPWSDYIKSMVLQPDGKILTTGNGINGQIIVITRHLSNGALDSSFGLNGVASFDALAWGILYPVPNDIAIMADGRIVIGAEANIYALNPPPVQADAFLAIRLLPDGNIDTTFNHLGIAFTNYMQGAVLYCKAMCLQPDGKVLLGGYSDSISVVRFDTSGQLDGSFGSGGVIRIQRGNCHSMKLQPDGKILLAGPQIFGNPGNAGVALYRRLTDGSPDPSFGIGGHVKSYDFNTFNDITLQSDGKIIVGGCSYDVTTTYLIAGLVRFTANATSVDIINIADCINIYPNPASNIIYIQNPSRYPFSKFSLHSMDGTLLRTLPGTIDHLDTEGLPDGMYLIQLQFADQPTLTRKLIIKNN
jgi:uncharacterized delta-60 repeat protein